jgi:hypothetical protein
MNHFGDFSVKRHISKTRCVYMYRFATLVHSFLLSFFLRSLASSRCSRIRENFFGGASRHLKPRLRGNVFIAQSFVFVEEALVSSRSSARNAAQD